MQLECSLVTKDDWLEYNFGSSLVSKIIYFIILVCGIGSLVLKFLIDSIYKNTKTVMSEKLKKYIRILILLALMMIVIPILFFIMDYTSSRQSTSAPIIVLGVLLLTIVSIFILILMILISNEIGAATSKQLPSFVWALPLILIVSSVLLFIYRYKTWGTLTFTKRIVDWKNLGNNASLIEKIAKKQFQQCGIEYMENLGLYILTQYISNLNVDRNSSWFYNLFASKKVTQLPADKYPNFVKMYNNMLIQHKGFDAKQLFNVKKIETPSFINQVSNSLNPIYATPQLQNEALMTSQVPTNPTFVLPQANEMRMTSFPTPIQEQSSLYSGIRNVAGVVGGGLAQAGGLMGKGLIKGVGVVGSGVKYVGSGVAKGVGGLFRNPQNISQIPNASNNMQEINTLNQNLNQEIINSDFSEPEDVFQDAVESQPLAPVERQPLGPEYYTL